MITASNSLPGASGTSGDDLSIIQINLNHCRAANILLDDHITKNKIDIALVQDAYVVGGSRASGLYGFPSTWKIFSSKSQKAHIIISNTTLIYSYLFCTHEAIFINLTLKEGDLIIGSVYIPPSNDNFQEALEGWKHMQVPNKFFLCAGDFNANSPLWGCTREDERGRIMNEFLIVNQLTLTHINNEIPTFEKYNNNQTLLAKGFPDLTITNINTVNFIRNWLVLDNFNDSDHKYITYKVNFTPQKINRRRFYTTKGNFRKFQSLIKQKKQEITNRLNSINNTDQLNDFTEYFIKILYQASKSSFRLKQISKQRKYTFWNTSLKITRNKLTAMRRRLKNCNRDELLELRTKYNQYKAKYKKDILEAKDLAWKTFCNNQTNPFGIAQKFFSGKFFTPDEILLERPAEEASRRNSLESLTEELFGPSVHGADNSDITFDSADDLPFTQAEIHHALFSFNVKKAPGPDSIDFNILRLAYRIIPSIFLKWCNKCLNFNYFPLSLRRGEVVYFLKQGKQPSEPSSYRPICLLPTLGKLLEKLLVSRLNHYMEINKLFNEHQFGFREGKSCEKALAKLLSFCAHQQSIGNYTSLVSTDIKGAFDNVDWRDLILELVKIGCPKNIAATIASYLNKRSIILNWGGGTVLWNISKGCPQGSCLGPILWLLIANRILSSLILSGLFVLAFADDFSFIFFGRRRLDVETMAREGLDLFSQLLASLKLQLSPEKSKSLTFNKPKKLKGRPPTIRINNVSVHHVENLKLLGITLDKNLSWTPHVNYLKTKLLKYHHNAQALAPRTWGVKTFLLKHWYQTIIEKIITYGAGVWGGSLSKQTCDKLLSLQRMFLLLISRGYKTISTNALHIITGIVPIHLTLKYEYLRSGCLHHENINLINHYFPNTTIVSRSSSWLLHSAREVSHLVVNPERNSHRLLNSPSIYTDGSKTNEGVASSFCVVEGTNIIDEWSCRLGDTNSVFQAELYAIKQALIWLDKNYKNNITYIFTDSLSSLQAIFKIKSKNKMVHEIKLLLEPLYNRVRLSHVLAHKGTFGNEAADALAKEATNKPLIDHVLPTPHSHIKKELKKLTMQEWQTYWDYSDTGRHTFNLIQQVSLKTYDLIPAITAFLSGHGPFRVYLCRFRRATTTTCECGGNASPNHYYFRCPLTQSWHIKKPGTNIKPQKWLENILTRPLLRWKLQQIYNFLIDLSNRT